MFPINTAKKYNGQKFRLFGTKTRKIYKPTHDDFFLHLNPLRMISGPFIVFFYQYG